MRTRSASTLAIPVIALMCAACASTRVTVSKVGKEQPNGIRYSLPRPFLLVTPNTSGDGGFKAEVIYLPDESQTYAVDAATKLGKHTLDVTVKDGLLSKIAWATTNAAVAAEATRATGELLKGELERAKKEDDEEAAKSKEAQKAAEEEVKKLRAELDVKTLDVAIAEEEVKSARQAVETEKTPEARAALRAAELKLAQGKLRRDAAQAALDERLSRVSAEGTFNEPTTEPKPGAPVQPQEKKVRAKFWGPVLYAIIDDGSSVKLKAVQWKPDDNLQIGLETAAAPTAAGAEAPKLEDAAERSFTWPAGVQTFAMPALVLTGAISRLDTGQRQMFRKPGTGPLELIPGPPFNATLDPAKNSITITFTSKRDPGKYQLLIPFVWGKDKPGSVTVDVEITP